MNSHGSFQSDDWVTTMTDHADNLNGDNFDSYRVILTNAVVDAHSVQFIVANVFKVELTARADPPILKVITAPYVAGRPGRMLRSPSRSQLLT